ncbi:MAG: hypothetical protein EZS28_049284 [Streblomastix strix]|uniref:Uncharacterized protein n=1 Tax=Streblomastix strix TaxID=222440 RepID=A0A5J4TAH1_9EUKA|nr:MAG: hypothetical protein EZS28_049284 [Streblomastix strix]
MDLVDGTSYSLHSAILILFITLDRPPVIPSLKQLHLLIHLSISLLNIGKLKQKDIILKINQPIDQWTIM